MAGLSLSNNAGVQTSQVREVGSISSGSLSTVQVQQSPVKLEIPTSSNNTVTTLDFDELLRPEGTVDTGMGPSMMGMDNSSYDPHKNGEKERTGMIPVTPSGGSAGAFPQSADVSPGLVGGGVGGGSTSFGAPQGDGSAIGGDTANGNDQRVVNVDEIITDGSVPPGEISKTSITFDDKQEYDLSVLPPEVRKNLTIETYGGEEIFVSKRNLMSLAEYNTFLESKGLNQNNFYKGKCKAFAGCQAMGLISPKAYNKLSKVSTNLGNEQFKALSSEWNYNLEFTSSDINEIKAKTVEEFIKGIPPILQVTQQTAGSRHWVALAGLKVGSLVNSYQSGKLDASVLSPSDFIVIDNAYENHPIRTLAEFGRDFDGRWRRTSRQSDKFRIHSANENRLNKGNYLVEPEQIRLGSVPNE